MPCELSYLVTLIPDETDGGFVGTFEDIPEAITQGEPMAEALTEAADALEEAIAGRLRRGDPRLEQSPTVERPIVPIPRPTVGKASQERPSPPKP